MRLTASHRPVDFARDNFDVAIRAGSPPWAVGADVVPLFPEQTGPVLAPVLAAESPAGFSGLPMLHTRTRPRAWEDWLLRSGLTVKGGARVDYEHFYFMLEAAGAALGVCVAPWPYVADDIRFGRLCAPLGFLESGQHYVALRRARRHRKSSLFCDWLRREALSFVAESSPQKPATLQTPSQPPI